MTTILKFSRDGAVVALTGLPVPGEGKEFIFRLTCSEGWQAELLKRYLIDQFGLAMRSARKQAYAGGWADAKAKRKRMLSVDDFSSKLFLESEL
jgi:hypothetical protein